MTGGGRRDTVGYFRQFSASIDVLFLIAVCHTWPISFIFETSKVFLSNPQFWQSLTLSWSTNLKEIDLCGRGWVSCERKTMNQTSPSLNSYNLSLLKPSIKSKVYLSRVQKNNLFLCTIFLVASDGLYLTCMLAHALHEIWPRLLRTYLR